MINVETEVFNIVSRKVRKTYPDIYMTGEYVKAPPTFPATSFVEADNSTYTNTQTSSADENHAVLLYDVDVYSNKVTGKKKECKDIISIIDNEMLRLGFTRIMLQPIPNMDDATIYRMKARYKAIVSKNKTIYGR